MATPPERGRSDGIATQIAVGIVVTVVGGLVLAFVQGWLRWPPAEDIVPGSGPGGAGTPAALFLGTLAGPPGTVVAVSGEGFEPGETVEIRFHTEECARTTASPSGTFSGVSCTIPADWPFEGQFDLVATGDSSIKSAQAAFRVT